MKTIRNFFIIVFIIEVIHLGCFAQDATVLTQLDNGSYIVLIGSDTLLTITQKVAKERLQLNYKVKSLEAELILKDSLIETYEIFEKRLIQDRERLKDYIADLESVYVGYKELSEGYKKLSRDSEGWLTFSGGIGASGQDTKPFILGGVGIKKFRELCKKHLLENIDNIRTKQAIPLGMSIDWDKQYINVSNLLNGILTKFMA